MKPSIQTLLTSINAGLIDREPVVKAALLTLLAAENLVLIGPPGTAKSMVARRVAQHIQTSHATLPQGDDSGYFEYLLTKFSTPEEIFGPLSITELKADRFRRNTTGYLPTAQVAFLDEIFKASSSILNALLTILNERIFHNGNQPQRVPLRSLISASNELPTGQEELSALYDRFLMRVFVGPVRDDQLHRLFDTPAALLPPTAQLTLHDLQAVDAAAQQVRIPANVGQAIRNIWAAHKEAFKEDRRETLSDRRLVKLLKLLRASAATNQRTEVDLSDAVLLQHCLWNHPDNIDKVREIVISTLQRHSCMVPMDENDTGADHAMQGHNTLQPTRTRTKGFAGSGTAQDPIRINTAEDLISMDDPDIALAGYHFVQTADIDCAAVSHWPLFAFKGHYHGNGKAIRNVPPPENKRLEQLQQQLHEQLINKLEQAGVQLSGLEIRKSIRPKYGNSIVFYALQATSVVADLRLEGCALAAEALGSRIENCHSNGSFLLERFAADTQITGCQVSAGGLVAGSIENSLITRCQVMDGEPLVTGIASESSISDCFVVADTNMDKMPSNKCTYTGLIAGVLYKSTVERCFVGGRVAGAVQLRSWSKSLTNFGSITDFEHFGGVTGKFIDSAIRNCAVGYLDISFEGFHESGRIV